ncbi:Dps family protein [Microaceticoccus formicicus]|uniref:Dps family protein n=1 Tax=Microaceticoccus formicicus TaxID=3118105 RepID=UPI003CD01E1C|nr:DNA starvation/stationary phase protection protein [Peptoniphilaceae bacterium AMB_02]
MKKVDLYLANLAVVNIKLHNLHWNVTGINFKAIHEYLEGLYDSAFEKFDEVAEYQKMNGVYPKARLAEYLEISDIDELESKDYNGKETIEITIETLEHMRDNALDIIEDTDCFVLSNMMEDHVTEYNKHIWFLKTMLK